MSQIHGLLSTSSEISTLDISSWAGAAEKPPNDSSSPEPQWLEGYYREIVMIEEKKFLDWEVAEWFKRVDPETVEGDRRVIIEGGKSLLEIPEEAMRVWREYEKRGERKEINGIVLLLCSEGGIPEVKGDI
jgi:hypothetical protein